MFLSNTDGAKKNYTNLTINFTTFLLYFLSVSFYFFLSVEFTNNLILTLTFEQSFSYGSTNK